MATDNQSQEIEDEDVPDNTVKGRLAFVEGQLDAMEAKIGLPSEIDIENAEEYLNLSRDALYKLSADACGIAAYKLGQFALSLQKYNNRYTAIVNWLDENIRFVVAKETEGIKAFGHKERETIAIANSPVALELYRIKAEKKLMADNTNFLTSRVSALADTLLDMKKSKAWQERS